MIDNGDEITAKIVFDLAKENDFLANEVVKKVTYYLGLACANISNTLNPETVVIPQLVNSCLSAFSKTSKSSPSQRYGLPRSLNWLSWATMPA